MIRCGLSGLSDLMIVRKRACRALHPKRLRGSAVGVDFGEGRGWKEDVLYACPLPPNLIPAAHVSVFGDAAASYGALDLLKALFGAR